MPSNVDPLKLRRAMGRDNWLVPQPFGPDGWSMAHRTEQAHIIVTVAPEDDGIEWRHASIARTDRMPSYLDLVHLHEAAFHDQWAYQVFAPRASHINIHQHALHLWGRLDGARVLPDFGRDGTI